MLRPVAVNLDPEEPGSGSKVPELEVRAQLVLDTLDGVLGLGSNGDIVHKHGDDDTHSVSKVDPDTVLADKSVEAELREHLVQLLVPAATGLLEAVERLAQTPHPLGGLLLKAFGLLHVDLLLELAVEVGRGDVHRLELEVLERSKGKDGLNGGPLGCRGKCLVVVEARTL